MSMAFLEKDGVVILCWKEIKKYKHPFVDFKLYDFSDVLALLGGDIVWVEEFGAKAKESRQVSYFPEYDPSISGSFVNVPVISEGCFNFIKEKLAKRVVFKVTTPNEEYYI